MRGRKPKSLELKILQGSPGHRPLEGSGAPFTVGIPEKPTGLEKFADEEWDRLVAHLAPILCPASRGMLLVCTDAYAQMMTANAVLQTKGTTYTTKTESGSTMIRQRPEVRMKESARRAYHQALTELGASPVAQTRVRRLPSKQLKLTGMQRLLG